MVRGIVSAGMGFSDYIREERSSAIGEALAKAGLSQGAEFQRAWEAPKPAEVAVTMNRQELHRIAWLADYGLRAWTMRSNNEIRRHHDRLPRERAEILSVLLDKFERKVADWLSETEDEREMRFSNHEDRMKRMWRERWVATGRYQCGYPLARRAAPAQFARPSEWIGTNEGANHLKDWPSAERLLSCSRHQKNPTLSALHLRSEKLISRDLGKGRRRGYCA